MGSSRHAQERVQQSKGAVTKPSAKRDPYAIVPHHLARDAQLNTTVRMLAVILLGYAGENDTCWPKRETLAQALGVTPRSVDRALDELQKKRGLRIEHHRYGNHYLVDALRLAPESTLVSSRVDTGVQSGPHRNGRESTLVSSRVDIDVDSRVDTGVHQSRRECPVHEKSIRKTITEEQQQEQQHAAAPADGTQANDAAGAGASAEPVSIDGHQAQGDAALLDSLLEIGVERAAAVTILKEHSAADVARQLEWLPYRKAANPAGMFVRAIRGGWGVPKGLAQQKQREADEREELEDAARRRANTQLAKDRKNLIERWPTLEEAILYFRELPPEEQQHCAFYLYNRAMFAGKTLPCRFANDDIIEYCRTYGSPSQSDDELDHFPF